MLGLVDYLAGVAYMLVLVGSAGVGGSSARRRLVPSLAGLPAHLAASVLALALLIWAAELLGAFGAFEPLPYLVLVGAVAVAVWKFAPPRPEGGSPRPYLLGGVGTPSLGPDGRRWITVPALIALAIAGVAVLKFCVELKPHLSTGMTGFDSTWYHGPFAAGFFQSGDTWELHFIAPQFLAWFYPANSEVFHGVGMFAFDRDVLSPLLNLGWFIGCLFACWCIGRPYGVGPWSLALGAVALSVPAFADQAGEARNDVVGTFFLLAAMAIALNAWAARRDGEGSLATGELIVIGLAAGLAAGTKLNFLLPAGVLILGLTAIAPRGRRGRALLASGLAALAGGGYWYLRNLVEAGNPLPWIADLGPISLPSPGQSLGGREAHSVLGYLGDGAVWSDWLLPGLRDGLWLIWPLLIFAAIAGLVLSLVPSGSARGSFRTHVVHKEPRWLRRWRLDPVMPLAGLVGLATALAWLLAPTSASGPEGLPRGFESGLRYLAPALVLGLALLPATPLLRGRALFDTVPLSFVAQRVTKDRRRVGGRGMIGAALTIAVVVAIGYPVQRHYLEGRYADPSFTDAPGLNAAFAWARDISGARIATTSTRQYPLFGTDLSNHVQFVGEARPHGGFEPPATCRAWREAVNAGDYDYVIATRDRMEKGKPAYPPQARWTEGPGVKVVLMNPPTVVFELKDRLDPLGCRS
ncbi:MAG TPA: hypothetical protein VK889_01915 [Solirubrobacterales bacterium]|nr:hypothetical protein [Solirubrobacterales bacterium]